MLTIGQEHRDSIEISVGERLSVVTFSPNGKYIFSGNLHGVRVWRVKDGKQMATMETSLVWCLAVSQDGRWIAAGTSLGDVLVWDAKTYNKVFSHKEDFTTINGVDFSPDSTRLVSTSDNYTAIVWDIATRERVQTLCHEGSVLAAKYSPEGDRIAMATSCSVRVYDSNDGRLLVDIEATVIPWYNTGLLWSNSHLLVVSEGPIRQFEASTGSPVSEWPVPYTNGDSCITLPKHRESIAYSVNHTVTFWDMATHTQLSVIRHPRDIRSITFSPDDLSIAIGREDGELIIENLSRITVSSMYCWVTACLSNFTAKFCWHMMLGIYS